MKGTNRMCEFGLEFGNSEILDKNRSRGLSKAQGPAEKVVKQRPSNLSAQRWLRQFA